MIVIDASSLVKYLLGEEGWRQVEEKFFETVVSLDLVVKEAANALWKHSVLRRIISLEQSLKLYQVLKKLIQAEIIVLEDQEKYIDEAFRIAVEHHITVYDSLYIAQALVHGRLLTSDKRQAEVAQKLGVETIFIE